MKASKDSSRQDSRLKTQDSSRPQTRGKCKFGAAPLDSKTRGEARRARYISAAPPSLTTPAPLGPKSPLMASLPCLAPGTLARPRPLSAAHRAAVPPIAGAPRVGNGVLSLWRGGRIVPRGLAASVVDGVEVLDRRGKDVKPIIVIDNYDSFTYNLCQYMGELGANFEVYRNDELTVEEIKRKNPRGILISPGPGTPQDSGISLQTVLELGPSIPLFGVCMGLQCIGEAFGGKIVRSPFGVVHGKSSLVYYDEKLDDTLFCDLPNPFTAGRYHSLVIEKDSFPSDELEITAWTEDGLIMATRHKKYRHIQGVQFHPESIITKEGKTMVHNFIALIERLEASDPQK